MTDEQPTYEELEQRVRELEQVVADRQEMVSDLIESENKYRQLFELESDALFLIDSENGRILEANRAAADMYGYNRRELLKLCNLDLSAEPESTRQAARRKLPVVPIRYHRKKDGTVFPVEITASHFRWQDRRVHIAAIREIGWRMRAEEALEESSSRFRELAENIRGVFWVFDWQRQKVLYVSPTYEEIWGRSRQPLMEDYTEWEKSIHPDDVAYANDTFMTIVETGGGEDREYRIVRPDGSVRWVSDKGFAVHGDDGELLRIVGIAEDITDRVNAEKALRESEARFRANFHHSPVGMAFIDTERRFLEVNRQMCAILGYGPDELIGSSFNAFTHPEDRDGGRERWRQLLAGEVSFNRATKRYVHKDGHIIWALVSNTLIRSEEGKPRYFLSHLVDITAQIEAQEKNEALQLKLQQAQKLEAMGTLAGGIAHDFNNLLMGIQGRASLMSADLSPAHAHREHLDAVEQYVRTATELTRQMLGLARAGKYEVRPVDVNELLCGSADMFGRTRKEIRIHAKLQDPAPVAAVDRTQIEQVLLNLFVNAWQAMPEGGALYLETRTVELDEAFCRAYQLTPGAYVQVSVTDTGVGMEESVLQRVFDPFFTTKEKGRGTGLGLASAYGIVKNHAGMITVRSRVGEGATFDVYLPLSEESPSAKPPAEPPAEAGSETILLVDDEEYILDIGKSMLERLGYGVVVAQDGKQAVEAVRRGGDRIDLLLIDMIMPEMDGGQVFDRVREMKPGLPVILTSGYSLDGHAEQIMNRGCNGFLQKPFDIAELSKKIRTILDR